MAGMITLHDIIFILKPCVEELFFDIPKWFVTTLTDRLLTPENLRILPSKIACFLFRVNFNSQVCITQKCLLIYDIFYQNKMLKNENRNSTWLIIVWYVKFILRWMNLKTLYVLLNNYDKCRPNEIKQRKTYGKKFTMRKKRDFGSRVNFNILGSQVPVPKSRL